MFRTVFGFPKSSDTAQVSRSAKCDGGFVLTVTRSIETLVTTRACALTIQVAGVAERREKHGNVPRRDQSRIVRPLKGGPLTTIEGRNPKSACIGRCICRGLMYASIGQEETKRSAL